ncbi:MAG TPA: galactokinase [Candidatus Binatia bacterium]|jgi:galactokinase|nr:galactokinase [Candidatus Binatia bacterium]
MTHVVASAPGRVNLIGEHTDYNDGLVLPLAIPQRTTVTLIRRDDDRICVTSAVGDGPREYRLGQETRGGDWLDYVQGCTAMLAAHGRLGGADLHITSTVPVGAGLSSSAALEVAVLRAFRAAFGLALDDVALAGTAHRAEHDFVGARVGIMDQMAASLADERTALYLDVQTMAVERVPVPSSLGLVVVDSGIAHRNLGGGYQARRAECDVACRLLGVPSLRALGDDALARAAALPSPLDRRVRHVVTENQRVRDTVAALRAGDLRRLGALFTASHASMRDDYAVSLPEIDALVERAEAQSGVLGARLTGGGFGGAIVVAAETWAMVRIAASFPARAWPLNH